MLAQHRSMGFLLFLLAVQCLCSSCQRHPKTVTIEALITGPFGAQISGAQMIVSNTAKDHDKAYKMSNPLVAYADQRGRYTMENLPPGRYRLIFVGDPLKTRVETYQLEAGQTLKISVRLRPDEEITATDCPSRPMTLKLPKDLNSAEVHLSRGRCYGTCPAYTLALYGDGRAEYDGEMYVAVKGHQSYRVDQSGVRDLITRFRDIGFFGFCGDYSETVTDEAAVETSLKIDGITKTVSVYGRSAPDNLEDLDAQIDAIAGVSRFVNTPPAPSK